MRLETFVKTTWLGVPAADVFRCHGRPGAFERLVPPWEHVEVLDRVGGIENGGRVTLRGPGGRWVVEHRDVVPGLQFRDVLLSGPFARWEHTHLTKPAGEDACLLEDRIEYALPFGSWGSEWRDAGFGRPWNACSNTATAGRRRIFDGTKAGAPAGSS